jgi:hypothetical protein
MGAKQTNSAQKEKDTGKGIYNPVLISKNNFDFMYVIGRGGFGKVGLY